VLGNSGYVDLITSDTYTHQTYNMGTVDDENNTGQLLRRHDPRGRSRTGARSSSTTAKDYRDYVAERVEPWSYLKFPYLKKVGWKGFVDGKDSGVYKATPLSRLNAPTAWRPAGRRQEYERFYETLGGKPVHHTLATHWARLVELLYAASAGSNWPRTTRSPSPDFRVIPTETPTEGVGCVEAPRGTLTHHYWTDERGVLRRST
jgi:F420-non-reducing hydrogenase large subunit